MELLKALHGLLKSASLFCKKFVKDIREIGFELNLCDSCVANGMVNGKQQTTVWHVNNVKASHVNSEVNDSFLQFVKDKHEDRQRKSQKSMTV